jgi:dihydropteroate synthase
MTTPIKFSRPIIVGILNATPDSFSDGGDASSSEAVMRMTEELVQAGADVIEIGGESTRPGSNFVDAQEERNRVLRTLDIVQKVAPNQPLGIDSRRDLLMTEALTRGVCWFNNVAGLCSDTVLTKLASAGAIYAAMHMYKTPTDMQSSPLDAAQSSQLVHSFFMKTQQKLLGAGFNPDKIFLDPGIGFGKSDAANFALMANVGEWSKSYNILMGISRKSFIGRMSGIELPKERDALSKAFEVSLIAQGARAIRTHDVRSLVAWASKVWDWNDERCFTTNLRLGDP